MAPQPQTIEEVFLSAIQLLPEGWGVEIILMKDVLQISCVNPNGEDVDYAEGDSTVQQLTNAVAEACYVDMLEGVDKLEELEP